jgi:hypothetical protein
MTGFESKRQAAQAKLDDEADTLTIVYQRGFADGKKAAQRKPLTEPRIHKLWRGLAQGEGIEEFARAIEAAHNIKEGT